MAGGARISIASISGRLGSHLSISGRRCQTTSLALADGWRTEGDDVGLLPPGERVYVQWPSQRFQPRGLPLGLCRRRRAIIRLRRVDVCAD